MSFSNLEAEEQMKIISAYIILVIVCIFFIIAVGWGLGALTKIYSVWSSAKSGEAELAKATYSRRIAVQEANAKKDAAVMLAQAEVERAKGVAQANKIIGKSLEGNEAYLRYLWIDSLQNTQNQTIYVPTEANLPILEANRAKNNIACN